MKVYHKFSLPQHWTWLKSGLICLCCNTDLLPSKVNDWAHIYKMIWLALHILRDHSDPLVFTIKVLTHGLNIKFIGKKEWMFWSRNPKICHSATQQQADCTATQYSKIHKISGTFPLYLWINSTFFSEKCLELHFFPHF